MIDLFISHCSGDKDVARRLRTDLEIYGYTVWLDETRLKLGELLKPNIRNAISNSRVFASVCSRDSSSSSWMKQEAEWAQASGVPVITILLDPSARGQQGDQLYVDLTDPDDQ